MVRVYTQPFRLNQEIRSAVAQRLAILDKQQRSELLDNVLRSPSAIESEPGARKLVGQEEILKGNSQLTENLSRIARNVQQKILQGAETNKTLGNVLNSFRFDKSRQTLAGFIKPS